MPANSQQDDFFFDPEHDESEGLSSPPAFASSPDYLAKQRDYLERLLKAWQTTHGPKKKAA